MNPACLKPLFIRGVSTLAAVLVVAIFLLIILPAATRVFAADGIHKQINFQGKLVNTNGTNVSNGDYSITFTLYDAASVGTNLWDEVQTVTVTDGIFRVALGSIDTTLGNVNFNSDSLYLGIKVGTDSEMTPRIRFAASPYAFNAQKVNGLTVVNTSGNPFASTTTFRIGDGKTVSVNNSLTFAGTDSTTITFPNANDTVVVLDATQTLTNKTIGTSGLTFSGATTDLTTAANEDFVLSPNGTGKIGFNTTTPLATLDLRYKSGTIPVASIAGITTNATLVVDNSGVGDIFAASTAGLTRFVIQNNGNVGIGKTIATERLDVVGKINATVAYAIDGATGLTGSNLNCVNVTGGLVIGTGACAGGGGSSNWNIVNGTIFPNQAGVLDLLIGGTASNAADFAIINVNGSGAVTATTSGHFTLTGANTAHTFNIDDNGSLNFIGSPGGEGGAAAATRLFIADTGNIGIGTTDPSQLLYLLNNTGARVVLESSTSVAIRQAITNVAGVGRWTTYATSNDGSYRFGSATDTFSSWTDRLTIQHASGAVGIGITNPAGHLQVNGGRWGGNAALVVNQVGATTNDIFTASASGVTKFVINNSGNVGVGTTNPLAHLDLQHLGLSGPTASISADNHFATLSLVNRIGAGDLLTASASGAERFTIHNSGQLKLATDLYNTCTALETVGGVLTCGTDDTGGGGGGSATFTVANGAIFPNQASVLDLLVGGTATSSAKFSVLNISANAGTPVIASVAGNLVVMPDYTKGNDTASGNVSIGTTSATERLTVKGNIKIEAKANNTTTPNTWTKVSSSTIGQIAAGGSIGVASVSAAVVYNGSLYVGTSTDGKGLAEVWRYNGTSGSWIRLNSTAGTFGGETAINGVTAMAVHNGILYIGTSKPNAARIYRYNGGNTNGASWTALNATPGTFTAQANVDAVVSMVSFGGILYIGTFEPNAGEVIQYTGGTANSTWRRAHATAGTICSSGTAFDSVTTLSVNNGLLFATATKGYNGRMEMCRYSGSNTWVELGSTTDGTYSVNGANITVASSSAAASYNGKLIYGIRKTNNADAIRLDNEIVIVNTGNFSRSNSAAGTIAVGGTTAIDGITALTTYNGRLYAGTEEPSGTQIYRYDAEDRWVLVSQTTQGQIASGGTTGLRKATILISWNGKLYAAVTNGAGAEIYEYSGYTKDQSFALAFHATNSDIAGGEQGGFQNLAQIFFSASQSASFNQGAPSQGAFVLDHSIVFTGGGFDVAEDYPTKDTGLSPGDLVSLDTFDAGYVHKARAGPYDQNVVGVISEKPGIRLSDKLDTNTNGDPMVPVALIGRVEVKVSSENGQINPGDALTTSSSPGVAMKATKAGRVIGKSLGSFSCHPEPFGHSEQSEESQGKLREGSEDSSASPQNDNACFGKVLTYITVADYNGQSLFATTLPDGLSSDNSAGILSDSLKLATVMATQVGKEHAPLSEINTDRVTAGLEIITKKLIADEIVARHIKAEQIDGLEIIETGIKSQESRIKDLEGLFASSSAVIASETKQSQGDNAVLSATVSADSKFDQLMKESSALLAQTSSGSAITIAGLTVEGNTTIESDLRVKEDGLVEGLLSVIDTITTKNLLVSGLTEFFGDVVLKGHITLSGDTAGTVVVEKGEKTATVAFAKEYEEVPHIQAVIVSKDLTDDEFKKRKDDGACNQDDDKETCQERIDNRLLNSTISYVVTKQSTKGFVVRLRNAASEDYTFSWSALSVKENPKAEKDSELEKKAAILLKAFE